jgi:lysine/arginine/ornithine transport system substrate-binding protein/histidine transport system substrate-binding protein
MKKILVAALFSFCASSTYAQDATIIRWGVDPTFAPYESVDPQGKLVGIDIELGDAVCKHLHAQCSWVKINFDGAVPALNAKKVDGILSGMTITEQRKKQVLFTVPLYFSPSRMMAPKDVTLDTTIESLKGKTVGIVQGTTQAAYANKHWKGKGVNLVSYQNDALAKQDLALGRVDATLQDSAAAQAFFTTPDGKAFHLTGTAVDDPIVFGHGVGIGLRLSDSALKTKIDGAVAALKKDGEYQKILGYYAQYGLVAPAEK